MISTFVWLVVVWLMLWGSADLGLVLLGAVVAAGVLLLYPLPPVRSRVLRRPHRLVGLGLFLVADLVISGIRVAWDAARYGRKVRAAVIAVPVLSDEDYVIATAANLLSLGPGKFVLQLDRRERVFYVYALGVRSAAEVDRARADVLGLQRRVIKAFGEPG
ncbi:Na+/H+ antiporter subunit E [Allokutzneria sp. A3M-2-11 16]|uniref:Na+/H+ antiporter subunit E n=1 Tax=Allokutzneria sp. A3M-2-11 16 TaxID=2962043 RepID=UPI0020B7B167|nr:Na+/H+ antiporter subunit E [Allokutzneria sp. A3M-2-11 16]MCP3804369.1 Na+/H+ antiporter subunit E [Allokutzneria sp. A3M-2-11 16]